MRVPIHIFCPPRATVYTNVRGLQQLKGEVRQVLISQQPPPLRFQNILSRKCKVLSQQVTLAPQNDQQLSLSLAQGAKAAKSADTLTWLS